MADNVTSDPGSGGVSWQTAELSWSGDTVHSSGSFLGILSGSEGSWTYSLLPGGAGAVTAGTPRITLASDDPGVAHLSTIAAAVSGAEMQVDIVAVTPDLMLGTDFSNVFGTASLVTGTQADNIANTADGVNTTSFLYVFDGTTWDRLRGDSTDGALVNLGTNNDVVASQSGTWNITNISGTVSLPTGAATAANQSTLIGHVDGIEGLLTTIDADTSTLSALSRAEDAAHNSGDTGIMSLAVRNDSDTSLAGTTGDYTPLQLDANGYLKVNIKAGAGSGGTAMTDDAAFTAASTSFTPAGGIVTSDSVDAGDGGAFAMLANRQQKVTLYKSDGTEATYAGIVDDAAFTPATSVVVPFGATFDDTTPDSVDEGDAGAVRMSANRNMYVTLRDAAGNERGLNVDASGQIAVTMSTLPAGTNNIGDVDVLSLVPGTGATNLGKAEDAAHTTGDVGVMVLGVRSDAGGALAGTDGDYHALSIDANGALRVTGGGGGTEYTEDAAAAADPVGGATILVRTDTLSGSTVTADGDNIAARAASTGAQYVEITAGTTKLGNSTNGLLVDLGANNDVTVTGSVTANAGTNLNTSALALESGGNLASIAGATHVDDAAFTLGTSRGVMVMGFAGTQSVNANDAAALACETDGALHIHDGGNSITVDNGGTFAVQAAQSGTWNITNVSGTVSLPTGAATSANQSTEITALQLIDNMIVAHDAAISGATGVAVIGLNARSAEPTAVASADATQALGTLLGKQVTLDYAIPPSTWNYAAASGGITNTTGVTAKAAAGAGIRNYITGVQAINGHATVSTDVQIRDGASGTVLWRGFAQAAGGGCSATFNPPLRGTANTLVEVACGTTGTATYINLQGFVAAE